MKIKFNVIFNDDIFTKDFIYNVIPEYDDQIYHDFESLYVKALERFVVETISGIDIKRMTDSEIESIIFDKYIDKTDNTYKIIEQLTILILKDHNTLYKVNSIETILN